MFSHEPHFDSTIINLSITFEGLKRLIVAISYVTGIALIARGLLMYRIFANQTYGSQQRGEIAGPLVFLIVGGILCYFPSSVDTTLLTVFGSTEIELISNPIAYDQSASMAKWHTIKKIVISYMTLIGLIAFVRGWIILSKMGHQGSQPGSVGKGVTHIIGGILLINCVKTATIIAQTFGYQL